jgi:hypothetical protein
MKNKLLIAGISFISLFVSTKGIAQVPTASFAVSQNTVCAGAVISFTDFSSDTPTSWFYTLGSPSNTTSVQDPTVSFATGGTYVITLEAANGSGTSTPFSETITVNPSPTLSIAGATNVCQGTTPSYTASGASSYLWSTGATTSTVSIPNIINSAILTATGTSAFGCKSALTILMSVSTLPIVGIFATNTVICNGSSVALGGTGATTYTWTGGVTNGAAFIPTVTQAYSVVGTSTNTGCTSTNVAVVTITVNPVPTISIGNFNICSGSTLTLNPTGAITYTYSNGSSTIAPTSNTVINISGTNSLGCTSSVSAVSSITVNASPIITVNNGTICSGTSFSIIPTGASNYTIQGGNTNVSPLSNSTYTVRGTAANGCISANTATSNLTVNTTPTVSVNNGTICSGTSFSIIPTGASTYTIQGGNTNVSPLSNSTYTVNGIAANGCISANTATSNLTVNATPTVSVNNGTICSGTSFSIIPAGASTYTIQGGNTNVSPLSNSTYTVNGTAANGCISANTATSNLTVNATPIVSVNNGTICSGTSFSIIPTGASTYTIQGGNTNVSPLSNSTYTVNGTAANGCISANTATSNLTVNAAPIVSVNNGTICSGTSFSIIPAGASTYTIQGGSSNVNPLSNSSYTVRGTSANGCISANTATSNLTVNAAPIVSVNNGTICSGTSFSIIPAGASTYTIQGGSSNVNPLSNTSYTVRGTSANGCISANTATSNVIVNPNPTITISDDEICIGESYTLSPSGANTYTISGGSAVITPNTNTTYSITGANIAGCVNATPAIVTITVNPLPTINASSSSNTICVGQSATLTANGGVLYFWSTLQPSTSIVVSPSVTSTYTVSGIDLNGCDNEVTFTQNVSPCTGFVKLSGVESNNVRLFPNPTNGIFSIELNNGVINSVEISDLVGKIVYTTNPSIEKINLDMANLANGIYYVKIQSNNTFEVIKIVKQ